MYVSIVQESHYVDSAPETVKWRAADRADIQRWEPPVQVKIDVVTLLDVAVAIDPALLPPGLVVPLPQSALTSMPLATSRGIVLTVIHGSLPIMKNAVRMHPSVWAELQKPCPCFIPLPAYLARMLHLKVGPYPRHQLLGNTSASGVHQFNDADSEGEAGDSEGDPDS